MSHSLPTLFRSICRIAREIILDTVYSGPKWRGEVFSLFLSLPPSLSPSLSLFFSLSPLIAESSGIVHSQAASNRRENFLSITTFSILLRASDPPSTVCFLLFSFPCGLTSASPLESTRKSYPRYLRPSLPIPPHEAPL